MIPFPAPGRGAEGNSREDEGSDRTQGFSQIGSAAPNPLPGRIFPFFPGKEAASRGHTIDGDGIHRFLLPALPEALFQEDKWRQEATFPRLERIGNGIRVFHGKTDLFPAHNRAWIWLDFLPSRSIFGIWS